MPTTAVTPHSPLPPTILGGKALRMPTGGKIRAGIKVLTRAAAGNAQAKAIYDKGVAKNLPFDEISKQITAAVPELSYPLTPRNVQYFTVRPCDFPNPEVAQQILDLYGEDRGDGKRLYRFPVIFAADNWQSVMPHEMTTWGTSGKKFWSAYSADGRVRSCMTYAPATVDKVKKRAVRSFGGRKHIPRPDNHGICDPEHCPEYQNKQCNLSGRFQFYIPGIKSISAIEIATNSFYAMNNAIQKFETIAFMRGGRISGFLDKDRTPFYITKKVVDMPHIDENGQAVRVKHWVIDLEAPVDVSELLRVESDDFTAIANGTQAVRMLEVAPAPSGAARTGAPVESSSTASQEAPRSVQGEVLPPSADGASAKVVNDAPGFERPPIMPVKASAVPDDQALTEVYGVLRELGADPARFQSYADGKYGTGWKMNASGRRMVMNEIETFRGNPQGLTDLIAGKAA